MQMLPVDKWETQINDYLDYTTHGMDASQCIMAHKERYFAPMIWKTMVSTAIVEDGVCDITHSKNPKPKSSQSRP